MSVRLKCLTSRAITALIRQLTPVVDFGGQRGALSREDHTLNDVDLTRFYAWRVAHCSAFVRRLLFRSHDDPAKHRILKWLLAVDDAQLLKFGLTHEDIVVLRTTARGRGG